MIKIYPYETLGTADYGWLKPHYHFSFGSYQNPKRTGFGDLLVINDDIIAPHSGFDMHGHRNMEIITYVRQGAISHEDSLGNEGRTEAGDVQVMSAGRGIRHAEWNREDIETNLYQIWIKPRTPDTEPRWDSRHFPEKPTDEPLTLLVSGFEEDQTEGHVLAIDANARIYGGRVSKGKTLSLPQTDPAYLLVSEGAIEIDDNMMKKGDGAEISPEPGHTLSLTAKEETEMLLITLS